uniref:Uncharacterized protein n=1 Tax=Steinernema glaseri TaxID=37863 RepID=A0A1I8A2B7_9BILA
MGPTQTVLGTPKRLNLAIFPAEAIIRMLNAVQLRKAVERVESPCRDNFNTDAPDSVRAQTMSQALHPQNDEANGKRHGQSCFRTIRSVDVLSRYWLRTNRNSLLNAADVVAPG